MQLPNKSTRDKALATGNWECKEPTTVTSYECTCPEDYFGRYCEFRHVYECYFNVTNPPLFKRCHKEDSFEYMYSIPGWDPCHPIKPEGVLNITGFLTCTISIKIDREVTQPSNNITELPTFDYDIYNPDIDLIMTTFDKQSYFNLGFQDWKFIS